MLPEFTVYKLKIIKADERDIHCLLFTKEVVYHTCKGFSVGKSGQVIGDNFFVLKA